MKPSKSQQRLTMLHLTTNPGNEQNTEWEDIRQQSEEVRLAPIYARCSHMIRSLSVTRLIINKKREIKFEKDQRLLSTGADEVKDAVTR